MLRPLAVFSIATGVTLTAALQLWVGGARGSEGPAGTSFFPGYDLAKLEIAAPTLYHVRESYVDRSRVDWEAMYVAALDAVERRVPAAMFGREQSGAVVTVEIGDFRTVLEVPPITSMEQLEDELRRVAALLAEHLDRKDVPLDELSTEDPLAQVEYALVNGMLSTLDPHSVLLPPEDAREMDVENQGEFGGLGITLAMDPRTGRLAVQCPIPGTPADDAGIEADDQIVRIDGESTLNMTIEDAINRLRGPVGADVHLDVTRGESDAVVPLTVRRELIDIHPVKSAMLDGGVGYVKIEGFHEQVERDLTDQLAGLHRRAAEAGGELQGLVLDLRGNPGGYLNQAVKVADMFLDSGDIVSQIDGSGRRTDVETARKAAEPFYPVAVLVDANSASASEIVAGALRYNERAVIVGERTFGKGSVQNLHPFYDESKLKLTISKYLTPGDRSIQAVGIPADIELDPAVVPGEGDAPARLYARERLRREADLDQALESVALRVDEPAWRIRYLDDRGDPKCGDEPDVTDPQVSITRDVLKAATGWRRSDVLASAAPVVARYQRAGNDAVVAAFRARGVDWTDGPSLAPGAPAPLDVKLDLGDDGRLVVGAPDRIAVVATNTGAEPLYRVAVVLADNPLLEGRELQVGKLAPGETRRVEQVITLPAGYASEQAPVTLEVRDAGERPVATVSSEVVVEGRELPAFAWTWKVTDAAKGDGDGVLDVGETVEVEVELTNVGKGPTAEPFVRLRNKSRRAIDLVTATLSPGECVTQSLPTAGRDEAPCARVLAAGAAWKGAFELEVKSAPDDGGPLEVELTLGDSDAYDHASIVREGFSDWFGEHDRIEMRVGEALPASADGRRDPPAIEISRAPGLKLDGGRTTLSGVVTDDRGLKSVMVFVGDDKVLYEGAGAGGGPIRSLPFTADVALADGSNVITVLATDDQGLVRSRAVVTWAGQSALAKASER